MKDGVLFVNKPKGLTSRDVVNQISKIYHTKKVGHTGTLDPMAKGLLIVCLGRYTKLVDLLTTTSKEYIAIMKLGIKTDTGDITGNILQKEETHFSTEQIKKCFDEFPKSYIQTVPIYSAVKVNGKKLYEYARMGSFVELPNREVNIYDLEILKLENDTIEFKTTVSKGTYIRALIEDIAHSLGTIATMTELNRTKQGDYSLEESLKLESITEETPLKTLEDLFSYPKIEIAEEQKGLVENGGILSLNTKEEKVFLTFQKQVIAIYEKQDLKYKMVFKVI